MNRYISRISHPLISDVVRSQIDVRGIEIPDYEYVEEESDEETDETEGADEEVEEQENELWLLPIRKRSWALIVKWR